MHPSQKNIPKVFGLSTESLKTLAAKNPFYGKLYNVAKDAPRRLARARKIVRELQLSNIMKPFKRSNENPVFLEALKIRERLTQSISEAQAAAEAASAQFHSVELPQSTVENAISIMDGNPARALNHGLALEQAEAAAKVKIFKEALTEQNLAIYALTSTLSSELSQNLRGEHAEIVGRIADSLASLGDALQAEQGLRDKVEAAGFRCTLPSFQAPRLGLLSDRDSILNVLHRDASNYAQDIADELSGALNKPSVIRLLTDCHDAGKAGDVIEFDGKHARHLVRIGRAEFTTEKLRRLVPKPSALVA